jgi:hypothetical protein
MVVLLVLVQCIAAAAVASRLSPPALSTLQALDDLIGLSRVRAQPNAADV